MKLVLSLVGPPRLMGARQLCELRAGSLLVGRSPEADWVIPDTNRLISRLHCRIDAGHDDFVLTDTSANGVYVNGSDEPVGYGAAVKLRDGDRLRLGEAQIVVAIRAGSAGDAVPQAGSLAAARGFDLDADAFVAQIAQPSAARDPLGGPFGAAKPAGSAAPTPARSAPARAVIDANWMNGPAEPAPAMRESSPAALPARSNGPPSNGRVAASAGQATDPLSVVALVEADAALSIRRLAGAIDAARSALDPQAWQDFHHRVKNFVQNDSI